MSCESSTLPEEAGKLEGDQESVETGLCSFLCVCGAFGFMLYSSVYPTVRQM